MYSQENDNTNSSGKAWLISLLVHAAILLLFFFFKMVIPNPPLFAGGSSGVEVNFGTSVDGMGTDQEEPPMDEIVQPTPQPTPPPAPQQVQEESKTITQETEDAPAIAEPPKKKEEKKKEVPKVQPKEIAKPVQKKVEESPKVTEPPKPVVNQAALYKGKKNNNSSPSNEGETGKPGDQGVKEGSLYSKNRGTGSGTGNGTGSGTGSGSGEGSGIGDGTGAGSGKGISFNLAGRRMTGVPRINDKSQETGKVVVAITVDKTGQVIKAVPGARGSTTTSSALYAKAQQAAMQAKFNANPDATELQVGTITFVFIVQ